MLVAHWSQTFLLILKDDASLAGRLVPDSDEQTWGLPTVRLWFHGGLGIQNVADWGRSDVWWRHDVWSQSEVWSRSLQIMMCDHRKMCDPDHCRLCCVIPIMSWFDTSVSECFILGPREGLKRLLLMHGEETVAHWGVSYLFHRL